MKCVVALLVMIANVKSDYESWAYIEDMWSAYPTGQFIEWPCKNIELNYSDSGRYYPINILPTRFQMNEDIVYILTPRYRCGVPASLNRFQLLGSRCMIRLEPWPDLEVNSICNSEGILNAIDLMLDSDGILWLLDIGEENTLGPPPYKFNTLKCSQNCTIRGVEEPPRVLGIHTGNCSLEYRFELSGLIADQSRLQYITVEKTRFNQKFIYVTDAGTRSLIMFEADGGRGFRILLPSCLEEGELSKDILYMTLVARQDCVKPSSLLFLTYLTSRRMFVLPTDKLWKKKTVGEIMLVGPKPGPMVILGSDGEKRIFFRMRGDCDIFVWNVEDEFTTSNFRLVRTSTCRRATHVAPGYLGMIWVLESNFHDYVRGTTGCAGPSTKLLPIMNQCDDIAEITDSPRKRRKKKLIGHNALRIVAL